MALNIETACLKFILDQLIDELSVFSTSGIKCRLSAYLKELRANQNGSSTVDVENVRSVAGHLDQDQLQMQLEQSMRDLERIKVNTKTMIEKLDDEIENVNILSQAKDRMTDSWENAQIAQKETEYADQMEKVQCARRTNELDIRIERLAMDNLAMYVRMKEQKLEEEMEIWNTKYVDGMNNAAIDEEVLVEAIAYFEKERLERQTVFVERQRVIEARQKVIKAKIENE